MAMAWSAARRRWKLRAATAAADLQATTARTVAAERRWSIHTSKTAGQRTKGKGKGSPYSITERSVPELIPVLGSQPAGDVSHKPGGTLPSLSARPAVTPATLKRAATNFAAW